MSVLGLKNDTEVIDVIQSYGFCYDVACTANSILYTKKRSKKNMMVKQFEAIYAAHNKLGMTIDIFSIIERLSLSKRLKIQPEEGQVRVRRVLDFVRMYLDGPHLSTVTTTEREAMEQLAAKVDEGDGLPVLVPDAAVAVIKHVLSADGKEGLVKRLGRPNVSVSAATKYLKPFVE